MLLRFGFSNYLSIKDYQEINFSASVLNDKPNYLISREGLSVKLLPCVGIYGANASGKSNILRAFSFFRKFIINSQTKGSAKGGIPRRPFLLDAVSITESSIFDCDFLLKGVRYHYGIIINNEIIEEEWLYSYPTTSRRVLFHRDTNEEETFYFGRHLKGKNKNIENLTRDNSLFLSSAAQNNHESLTEIYDYFEDNFLFRFDQEPLAKPILANFLDDTPLKDQIISFLKNADIGISDAVIEEQEYDEQMKEMQKDLFSFLNKHIAPDSNTGEIDKDMKLKTMKLGHHRKDGTSTFFELEDESRGTLCLLSIIGPTLEALNNGKTFFVDEIDSSMHPMLSMKLVDLFTSEKTNPKGAQLIFTTHDINLLSNKTLRRDEIWFTEKSTEGETNLFPLSDIKTRNTDNFLKGYIQGRYGAIPFLGNIDELFAHEEN